MRSYLEPTAPIAPQALLMDDPKGAMDLATVLCDSPRMSNLSHGLWGYGGKTRRGLDITIQSLGIGGPSAAAVVSDLAGLGVRRAIRIGSCIALDPALEPGEIIVGTEIEGRDGVSLALSRLVDIVPDQALTRSLTRVTGGTGGAICSVDHPSQEFGATDPGSVCDLSTAAVVAAGAQARVETACVVVVAEAASGELLSHEDRDEALIGLGMRAVEALDDPDQAPGA